MANRQWLMMWRAVLLETRPVTSMSSPFATTIRQSPVEGASPCTLST